MSTQPAQEFAASYETPLRPPPVEHLLAGACFSIGTASSWGGLVGPSPTISVLGERCADARNVHLAIAANTGWSVADYKTLVLFYPVPDAAGLGGMATIPIPVNYDLRGNSVEDEAQLESRRLGAPTLPLSPQAALSDISGWTGLTTSRLGDLLGVARRSLYNWIEGRPISGDMQYRVQAVHSVVARVASRYDPQATRVWLDAGEPSNFELLRDQRWALIGERLPVTRLPRATRVDESLIADEDEDSALLAAARSAVFELFASADRPTPEQVSEDSWTPIELTGAIPFDEDTEDS